MYMKGKQGYSGPDYVSVQANSGYTEDPFCADTTLYTLYYSLYNL